MTTFCFTCGAITAVCGLILAGTVLGGLITLGSALTVAAGCYFAGDEFEEE
jgi:hypothetical protein